MNLLQQTKFYSDYSRWIEESGRYETWDESVNRVIAMHRQKYAHLMTPKLDELIEFAAAAYREQLVLGAQRALQYGGEQIFNHETRIYNCSVSYVDRPQFFGECMYLLLSGCGVGFSVQKHHTQKLPQIARRSKKKVKLYRIPDTIEGWSDAFSVLLSSYFLHSATHPEYKGCQVHFDFSDIRPKGAKISGGFKAPGPDPLRNALIKCEELLEDYLEDEPVKTLDPITVYDFVMYCSDAVLSGGVRRSATICVFDKDEERMMKAKTGDWWVKNPQRGRSNNSVILLRNEVTFDEWSSIIESVKDYGEPGFIFTDNKDFLYNPCVEIGMYPQTEDGRSGFQFCNLTEINGARCSDRDIFLRACKASAILGTLQAGYTNFKYLSPETREITEKESLIGCSITGWMNNYKLLFDATLLEEGAAKIKAINAEVAALLGINAAARTTCVKPSGNASTLLGCASGIHGEHAKRYIRNVQMSADSEVSTLLQEFNPKMVERSVWSANGTDVVVSFPVEVDKENSLFKDQLLGVKQLEYVKLAQKHWVEPGTNVELCAKPELRHNVSNTVEVDNWEEVKRYIYENRYYFCGISLLAFVGDKAYNQAPFTKIATGEEILERYKESALFASGLIVDALHAFNQNLWLACDTFLDKGLKLDPESSADVLKRDWIRRAQKFTDQYFDSDKLKMTLCLKDVYNLHKWYSITNSIKEVNFSEHLNKKEFIDPVKMAAQACAGGTCELEILE